MAGRRPKPTALKIAQGNPGKRPLNELEPDPDIVTKSTIPTYLSKQARKWWELLAPMLIKIKVLTEADQLALALLCEQSAQVEQATKLVRKSGVFVKKQLYDRAGKKIGTVPVLNPAFKIQFESHKQVKAMLTEFGITPASRAKVTKVVRPEELKKDPLGELRARVKRSH